MSRGEPGVRGRLEAGAKSKENLGLKVEPGARRKGEQRAKI